MSGSQSHDGQGAGALGSGLFLGGSRHAGAALPSGWACRQAGRQVCRGPALVSSGTHAASCGGAGGAQLRGYRGVCGAKRGAEQAGRLAVTVTEAEKKVKQSIF